MTNESCSDRPRMWVSGSTSIMPLSSTWSTTSLLTSAPSVSNTACAQGCIFSPSEPGQVAELLATDRVQRPEDDDLLERPPLEHVLQPRAERERRLAGAGPAAERDDPDLGVEQQVQRDPLLGRPPVQPERLPVAPYQPDLLVRR